MRSTSTSGAASSGSTATRAFALRARRSPAVTGGACRRAAWPSRVTSRSRPTARSHPTSSFPSGIVEDGQPTLIRVQTRAPDRTAAMFSAWAGSLRALAAFTAGHDQLRRDHLRAGGDPRRPVLGPRLRPVLGPPLLLGWPAGACDDRPRAGPVDPTPRRLRSSSPRCWVAGGPMPRCSPCAACAGGCCWRRCWRAMGWSFVARRRAWRRSAVARPESSRPRCSSTRW